ncbi:MAG: GGDEF and EAL domain-containing protein [Clostridiales bacterium]|nr:GGDEF and EAL domain-containing protein [Clostridiales bacterium]
MNLCNLGQGELNEIRKMQSELLQTKERYKILLSLNSDCFFEYDFENDMIMFSENKTFPQLNEVSIAPCKTTLADWFEENDARLLLRFLKEAQKEDYVDVRLKTDDGLTWCRAKGYLVKDEKDQPIFCNGCLLNIDDQKKVLEQKREKSQRDLLTGLYHFRAAQQEIAYLLGREELEGKQYLSILDVDDFGKFSRKYGHVTADFILIEFAHHLKELFGDESVIGRIGSDKFLIFTQNKSFEWVSEKIHAVCDYVEKSLEKQNIQEHFSCCMGSVCSPDAGRRLEHLFRKADVALFQAKQAGEDHFVLFCSNEESKRLLTKDDDYYNIYSEDERVHISSPDVDMELLNIAFDVMNNGGDSEDAINHLLEQIGRQFMASDILVLEMDEASGQLWTDYIWTKEEGLGTQTALRMVDMTLPQQMNTLLYENGLWEVRDTSLLQTKESLDLYFKKYHILSALSSAFYEDGIFKGCICIGDRERSRRWTAKEKDTLAFVSRILSFYLLRLRVSERINQKMETVKNFDTLTGIFTEYKFKLDAHNMLRKNPGTSFAVISMDFKHFKVLNDTLGYHEGDELLKEFVHFMVLRLIPHQLFARASADNFISLCPMDSIEDLLAHMNRISDTFCAEQRKRNVSFKVELVSGIYVIRDHSMDISLAVDYADIARKSAKEKGISQCQVFDDGMENQIRKEHEILNNMEKALRKREFQIFLQPKIDLRTSRLAGAEALTRWRQPDGRMIPPNDFIPLFERNGFIIKMDFYVYEEVCKLMRFWMDCDYQVVPISMNVSRVQLNFPGFTKKVTDLVDRYEIPHELIEFELTESVFLDHTDSAIQVMNTLRENGFGISIDDFGAGYSSLNLLKDMTTDVLKLDKEFFRKGEMKREEKIIVSSIIGMAKQLNMKVLSEGVETTSQMEFLKQIECDLAQGYLYAKPLPVMAFEEILRRDDQELKPREEVVS